MLPDNTFNQVELGIGDEQLDFKCSLIISFFGESLISKYASASIFHSLGENENCLLN